MTVSTDYCMSQYAVDLLRGRILTHSEKTGGHLAETGLRIFVNSLDLDADVVLLITTIHWYMYDWHVPYELDRLFYSRSMRYTRTASLGVVGKYSDAPCALSRFRASISLPVNLTRSARRETLASRLAGVLARLSPWAMAS
ncbi:hypothetical protein AG1IA_04783 [Rhizoctonia solani AG-1 IA]|uniref:Uncharacterized protein n=1 Tax=Thanatephorus cucumeris (strain AG1-IA) TaxID=983506 RepID=L8WWI3_THACA|nr:hypothetical protein AG1IA_04783 [Rhizoctonia solani AG-1 IA]